ncbi:MAG: hypothetical protein KAZ63_08355, partial [Vitreoscilla sp.]|nr:hypothetical protein [Vitreoscilla sp.]
MSRTKKLILVLVALAVLALAAFKVSQSRRAAAESAFAASAAASAPQALELASSDIVVARLVELTRAVEVTGSIKAVQSA